MVPLNVRNFMTDEPVTCDADDTIEDAAGLMDEHEVGCVVVLDETRLAGLVTDRQVAMGLGSQTAVPSDSVSTVMTSSPVTVDLESNLFEVLDTMRGAGLPKRLPVVDGDRVVGLVSVDDIAVIADNLNQELFRNYTNTSLEETEVPTGAKRVAKKIRAPTQSGEQDPEDLEQPITVPHTEREHERKAT